ncbi:MAG: DUF2946 family protein [Burkholderiales bacterium]|nr:DUF2946 family protein [Burkholderiales bacterium]
MLIAILGALAVPMSHAMARGDWMGLVQVCTSTGTQTVSSDSAPVGRESAPLMAHCPLCLHHADSLVAPPGLQVQASPVVYLQRIASVWQATFTSTYFAFAPPPRGPPRFI